MTTIPHAKFTDSCLTVDGARSFVSEPTSIFVWTKVCDDEITFLLSTILLVINWRVQLVSMREWREEKVQTSINQWLKLYEYRFTVWNYDGSFFFFFSRNAHETLVTFCIYNVIKCASFAVITPKKKKKYTTKKRIKLNHTGSMRMNNPQGHNSWIYCINGIILNEFIK